MRPPHEAGEVGIHGRHKGMGVEPSMRPPHEAGEVHYGFRPVGGFHGPSMRPPHEAGEVFRSGGSSHSAATTFNEAPARGGGGRGPQVHHDHDAPPSMRPPHEAGEVDMGIRKLTPYNAPSMRPPHEAGEVSENAPSSR